MTDPHVSAMQAGIDDIGRLQGVISCALVEAGTGLIIHSVGGSTYDPLAETASSYWKLGDRLADVFRDIGPQRALSVQLQGGVFSVMPCGDGMLLATLSRANGMDWKMWLAKVSALSQQLDN